MHTYVSPTAPLLLPIRTRACIGRLYARECIAAQIGAALSMLHAILKPCRISHIVRLRFFVLFKETAKPILME